MLFPDWWGSLPSCAWGSRELTKEAPTCEYSHEEKMDAWVGSRWPGSYKEVGRGWQDYLSGLPIWEPRAICVCVSLRIGTALTLIVGNWVLGATSAPLTEEELGHGSCCSHTAGLVLLRIEDCHSLRNS